jgi:hypothetical protein
MTPDTDRPSCSARAKNRALVDYFDHTLAVSPRSSTGHLAAARAADDGRDDVARAYRRLPRGIDPPPRHTQIDAIPPGHRVRWSGEVFGLEAGELGFDDLWCEGGVGVGGCW